MQSDSHSATVTQTPLAVTAEPEGQWPIPRPPSTGMTAPVM